MFAEIAALGFFEPLNLLWGSEKPGAVSAELILQLPKLMAAPLFFHSAEDPDVTVNFHLA
jgi:hypothetical protein